MTMLNNNFGGNPSTPSWMKNTQGGFLGAVGKNPSTPSWMKNTQGGFLGAVGGTPSMFAPKTTASTWGSASTNTTPFNAAGPGITQTEVNALIKQQLADSINKGQISEAIGTMNILLQENDLGALAARANDMLYQGKSYKEVYASIINTQEYADRFPGMSELRKKGIAITEAKYNEQMNTYSNVFKRAGLDNYADFKANKNTYANFLINDVSPDELKTRVNTATSFVNNADQTATKMFQDYYGISKKDLVAYYLDPSKAVEQLQSKAEAAKIGAVGAGSGLDIGSQYAESLASRAASSASTGINTAVVGSAISYAGGIKEEAAKLANIEGTDITGKTLIESKLGNDSASKIVEGLTSREAARFSGKGAGLNVLGVNMSGSY